MGVPTSEVGYTSAMPRREDHEVHKKDMWWYWKKKTLTLPSPSLKKETTNVVINITVESS
jgi:hypothetical protein